ncbi:BTAD domain-containing putative transcriptional regulator [Nocardia sp. NPDC049190]|uniref:AfsR/SARP family transcriptional regulator n=1 Tax=Nocardia sp. NPDC049190 TaxID=3155650 RepID=UPI00340877BF
MLALLLAARGEVVSVSRMVEELWWGDAPTRAVVSLQVYVSHPRRVLEPARERRAPARVLVTVARGYALRMPADAVDAGRFETLLAEARAVSSTDPGRARVLLRSGLDLWRGPAYAEFVGEPWAQPEMMRLEELRLGAREPLLDVTVRGGDAAEAVADGRRCGPQTGRRGPRRPARRGRRDAAPVEQRHRHDCWRRAVRRGAAARRQPGAAR